MPKQIATQKAQPAQAEFGKSGPFSSPAPFDSPASWVVNLSRYPMRASRFAWLLAILLALWCAEAHADACAGLSAPLSMLAWDQKSIIFVDGFSWSVSPTYLDANGQLQTYFAAAMGLQLQGIQEIANDQGDFCVADGNIDTTAFPWTNSAYYQIMNVSLLDCKYIQSTQYIRSANVTLNTTTIVAKSSSLPGFQITANLSTSDKEWSFVTHTDPSTNETLVSTYKCVIFDPTERLLLSICP